ncbi:MAG TPA: PepSY domain-containing protein [Candidatus Ruminococcus avistercoris]|nr:PepSY domain-containing protein [Candidatus Ruminococcus avistercoris]
MKKRVLIALAVLGTVFITACGGNDSSASPSQDDGAAVVTPTVTQEATPAVTEEVKEEVTATPTAETTAAPAADNGVSQAQNNTSGDDIGEAKAREIALEHAGLAEADVTFVKVRLDRDDGRLDYDVDFYSGNTEYDYEIDAATGEIVSFDSEIDDFDIPAQTQQSGTVISLEQAKEAALKAAGLDAANVKWIGEEFDRDDGRSVYELECVSGETEYDFEINAADGTVMEQGRESIYDD